MSLITLGKAIAPGAYNSATYDGANDVTVNYRTNALVSLGASTKNLRMRLAWPTEATADRPRALFLYCHMGGWTASNLDDISIDCIRWPVRMGMIGCAIEVRVAGDDPIDAATTAGMNVQSRSTYAACYDLFKAHQFALGTYRKTANFSIEPNWTYYAGSSCGGITGLVTPQLFSGRPVAGMVAACSAFGCLGSGLTDGDTYIRSTLGITEAGLTKPIWMGFNDDDNRITLTRLSACKTKADTISGSSISENVTGGHVGLLGWDVNTIASFISARCAVVTPVAGGLVFA